MRQRKGGGGIVEIIQFSMAFGENGDIPCYILLQYCIRMPLTIP